MSKSNEIQSGEHGSTPEPWQSWGLTTRYLVVRFGQVVLNALLVWLAYTATYGLHLHP